MESGVAFAIVWGMESQVEITSFRGDDDPRLVSAALACRQCLSGDVEWWLRVDDWEAEAECRCRECGHRRVVALNFQQALRLQLQASRPLAA